MRCFRRSGVLPSPPCQSVAGSWPTFFNDARGVGSCRGKLGRQLRCGGGCFAGGLGPTSSSLGMRRASLSHLDFEGGVRGRDETAHGDGHDVKYDVPELLGDGAQAVDGVRASM